MALTNVLIFLFRELQEYYVCCENLRDVLKDGPHILLHRCDWFEKAFPAI